MTVSRPNLLVFGESETVKQPSLAKLPAKEANHSTPIIIDAGSCQFRAGYATESSPSLVFEPMVHRCQMKGSGETKYIIGKAVPVGVSSKTSSRTPFESPNCNVIVHSASMEHILDHIFTSLKVKGPKVNHPIVITECPGNPEYCRKELCELLFECYGVPKVSFGIDGVFAAANASSSNRQTILVVSMGNTGIHILPIINGQLSNEGVKRIKYGGSHATEYLLKLLQMKYPAFPIRMTSEQAEEAFKKACQVWPSPDYRRLLETLETDQGLADAEFTLQFPFIPTDAEAEQAKAMEREAIAQRRREQAEKLREKARAKKEAQLKVKQEHLQALLDLESSLTSPTSDTEGKKSKKSKISTEEDEEDALIEETNEPDEEEIEEKLLLHGFNNLEELDSAIEAARKDLKAYENKLAGIVEEAPATDFSLLDVPDEELDETKIQEKRRLRLLKSNLDARERLRKEKEELAQKEAEIAAAFEEKRLTDFEGWKVELYSQRKQLIANIKLRRAEKDALSSRKSNLASSRLTKVTQLGMNEDVDDNFGMNDSDWQVYRDIKSKGQKEDELVDDEAEDLNEVDQTKLARIEEQLETYDEGPFYALLAEELAQSRTILDRLRQGPASVASNDDEAARYQLHLNVERWRVTEAIFQPGPLIGLDSAGLPEAITQTLQRYDPPSQAALLSNILLTGGLAQLPNLAGRLQAELIMSWPVGQTIRVRLDEEPEVGAWKGAARLAREEGELPWIHNS